jgi:hypothetical protein
MSTTVGPPTDLTASLPETQTELTPPVQIPPPAEAPRPKRNSGQLILWLVVLTVAALAVAGGRALYQRLGAGKQTVIPTAVVKKGDVDLSISARGDLRGGNPEALVAPMTGGSELHITFMKKTGELVKPGDMVVAFDTTEQEYKVKEADGDLAEAEQHLIQAKAQRQADDEEDQSSLAKAESDLKLAELEARKNPLLPAITAKQNDLLVAAAKDHLDQLRKNVANRKATGDAAVATQEAGRGKAESQGVTARANIAAMTLKAKHGGYFSPNLNTSCNFCFSGMVFSPYQMGDTVRPGVSVAEIPDLSGFVVVAKIGELDQGHLAVGAPVEVNIVAVPNHPFRGHVKELGGITGTWERAFECKIAIDDPTTALRPGMSAKVVIVTDQLKNVLSLPAQALFESDGRKYVYVKSGNGFAPKDVKLVRRNETRVVIEGLPEGQEVALANPLDVNQKKKAGGSAAQAVTK